MLMVNPNPFSLELGLGGPERPTPRARTGLCPSDASPPLCVPVPVPVPVPELDPGAPSPGACLLLAWRARRRESGSGPPAP